VERDDIVASILRAVDQYNASGHEPRIDRSEGEATPLYGNKGVLDSMGLVEFIFAVEDELAAIGVPGTLADQQALSQRSSPFRNVAALADFVISRGPVE
jgi:acyl carrier protein